MSTLLIIGAGGHGRVIADAALTTAKWNSVVFLDDRPDLAEVLGFEVIGTCADLERVVGQYSAAAVGIGDASIRLQLIQRCRSIGIDLPAIAHRSASVSAYASIGAGTVVFAQAAINPGAKLAEGCIVNTGATVDHDCELAEGVHVCPGAHLAGNVRVGSHTWIGIGACVKQGINIGRGVTVGAGAAVVSNIGPGLTVTGIPARARGNS